MNSEQIVYPTYTKYTMYIIHDTISPHIVDSTINSLVRYHKVKSFITKQMLCTLNN